MDILQIDQVIKNAQGVKRTGDVNRARNILEDCLIHCKSDGTPSHYVGLAPLHKSIAKLCYIQNDFDKAINHYGIAIGLYRSAGIENEMITNMMHLGCCSPEFRNSSYYHAYVRSLMGQGPSPLSDDLSIGLVNIGMSYFTDTQDDINLQTSTLSYKITTVSQLDEAINMGGGSVDNRTISPEMAQLLSEYLRGASAAQRGDIPNAMHIFRRVLAVVPSFVAPRVYLGNCLTDIGESDKGLEEFNLACQYAPHDTDVYLGMAKAYAYLGDPDNEIQMYEKIVQINPRHFFALNNLGATCRDLARLEDSEKWLLRAKNEAESIAGSNEQKLMVYRNLAMTYSHKNEIEQSIEYWQRCMRIDASEQSFWARLEEMQEKKRIKDTVQPIYLQDGSVCAPDGYELQLSGFGAVVGPWTESVAKEKYQGWLDVGYKFELIKADTTSLDSSSKSTPAAKSEAKNDQDNLRKEESKQSIPIQMRIPIPSAGPIIEEKTNSTVVESADNSNRSTFAKTTGQLGNNILIVIIGMLIVIGLLLMLSSLRLF